MADAPDNKRGVRRRDAEGRLSVAPSWESLIERQIRQAAEAGEFDDLPFRGKPLPNDENPYAGEWALAFHVLKNAGSAPPWIEDDKEVRRLLARRDAILSRAATGAIPSGAARNRARAELEDLAARTNASIARLNAEAPTWRQQRRPLVVEDEIARFEEACRREIDSRDSRG